MARRRQPVVLTIAGFDPSSGAGVTADIKTLAAHGCYGIGCVTTLTVQSTLGVRRIQPIDPEILRETLEELAADLPPAAVRIGMLGSAPVAEAVADFLERRRPPHVVLDPILLSTSGAELLDEPGRRVLLHCLLPRAEVVTPNLAEAAALTGEAVEDLEGMARAARRLHSLGARNVIVTGGHLRRPQDLLSDLLSSQGGRKQTVIQGPRIAARGSHGTGCAYATALAANLAYGLGLEVAARRAAEYVRGALAAATPLGHGAASLHHLFGFAPPAAARKRKPRGGSH